MRDSFQFFRMRRKPACFVATRFVLGLLICGLAWSANVYMIQPNKGPLQGGTQVTVIGSGFTASSTLCQFGSFPTAARFISASTVICYSPGDSFLGGVPVEVTTDVSGAPETFSADNVMFRYQGTCLYVDS